ncbi:hypothetical protein V8F20_000139 [Naviculisporaceae sp. PSN 640]
MSSRRQSSSSQGNQWYGDYTWSVPDASNVDGCGRRLSDLSLVTPGAPSSSDYPVDSTSCWGVSGYPGVSPAPQSDFASTSWEPVYGNDLSNDRAGHRIFAEPEQITLPSKDAVQLHAGTLPGLGHENFMDNEAGYTTSTHVSPSSSSPRSKRSTMDDYQSSRGYSDYRKSEKKSSMDQVPVQDKKKKRHQSTYHHGASSSSGKNNPPFDFRNRGGARFSPYPRVIPDCDLIDFPVSSPNDTEAQASQYMYHGSQNSEEDYDMCDSVGSPFSTIGTIDYADMPESST